MWWWSDGYTLRVVDTPEEARTNAERALAADLSQSARDREPTSIGAGDIRWGRVHGEVETVEQDDGTTRLEFVDLVEPAPQPKPQPWSVDQRQALTGWLERVDREGDPTGVELSYAVTLHPDERPAWRQVMLECPPGYHCDIPSRLYAALRSTTWRPAILDWRRAVLDGHDVAEIEGVEVDHGDPEWMHRAIRWVQIEEEDDLLLCPWSVVDQHAVEVLIRLLEEHVAAQGGES